MSKLEEEEEDSEDDNELLIHSMAKENVALNMEIGSDPQIEMSSNSDALERDSWLATGSPPCDSSVPSCAWAIIQTPVPLSPKYMFNYEQPGVSNIAPLSDFVSWPYLSVVMEIETSADGDNASCDAYTMESPTGSPIHDCVAPEMSSLAPGSQISMQSLLGWSSW